MGTRTGGRRLAAAAVAALTLAACGSGRPVGLADQPLIARPASSFALARIATGIDRPTYVGAAPGDVSALWVLEQPGRVLRVVDGQPGVALDMSSSVGTGLEAGLLGIAFHPRFATNRRLFLHWSDLQGDTRVAEFAASPDGTTIQPSPVRELLFVDQPKQNHNGGQLTFGPDGRLYLGLGDGGGGFDPQRTAQDPSSRLGKILATEVDRPLPRWVNVLVGLRNPWRFSFDSALNDLWVADVGQDRVEEVNRVRLELDKPPKNLGWSAYEGRRRIEGHRLERNGGRLVFPVATYTHDQGCSVIGGFVYGGTRFPDLVRRYFFGDFCSGTLWSLVGTPDGRATDVRQETARVPQLTHIGADPDGELVFASGAGSLFRAVPLGDPAASAP